MPFARDRLQLSGASLGALLLCLGIGSLAAMPITGTLVLVARFGCRRVMTLSTLLVLAMMPLLAFLLVGFGLLNTVPMLFNAARNQRDMPANLAISAMTTLGYAGILSGPALIGFISQWISLSGAFLLIALLLLVVAASARKVAQ